MVSGIRRYGTVLVLIVEIEKDGTATTTIAIVSKDTDKIARPSGLKRGTHITFKVKQLTYDANRMATNQHNGRNKWVRLHS